MQENRSFDHYFGKLNDYRAMQGLPADVDGLPPDSKNITSQGTWISSFALQTQCLPFVKIDWNASHRHVNYAQPASNTPLMDGFVRTNESTTGPDQSGSRAMGYYDWNTLPYYYAMATEFATSDRWFAPVPTASYPNKFYLFAGTSAGYIVKPTKTLSNPTIFQSLEERGISWKLYYGTLDSSGNPATELMYFQPFADQHRDKIVPFANYFDDLSNGTLPSVAFIDLSDSGLDEHPGGSHIQDGAHEVASMIDSLMASSFWHDSVFVLTFDEAGGFYDHVPPLMNAAAPDATAPRLTSTDVPGDFTRTGMRVPFFVVSPFAKKHYVSHTPADNTAILKLIETRFALPSLTARDAAQMDMVEFFDFDNPSWTVPPTTPVQPTSAPCYLDHLP